MHIQQLSCMALVRPGVPSQAQAPHPRHPSSLAPKCTELFCCPARAGPSPCAAALPASGCPRPSHRRTSSTPSSAAYVTCHCEVTSQRHAAHGCPVIGMSCSCKCRSTEQSLRLDCCSTSVKASLMRPCLVQPGNLCLILCKTLADVLILHSCQTGYSAHQAQQCLLGQSKLS